MVTRSTPKTNRCAERWERILWDIVDTWIRSAEIRSVHTLYTSSNNASVAVATAATTTAYINTPIY